MLRKLYYGTESDVKTKRIVNSGEKIVSKIFLTAIGAGKRHAAY